MLEATAGGTEPRVLIQIFTARMDMTLPDTYSM